MMTPEECRRWLTRRTTPERVRTELPGWVSGPDEFLWLGPPGGERWEEFLTGLYGDVELWEYCLPFAGETGQAGFALVRGGEVLDVFMIVIA